MSDCAFTDGFHFWLGKMAAEFVVTGSILGVTVLIFGLLIWSASRSKK